LLDTDMTRAQKIKRLLAFLLLSLMAQSAIPAVKERMGEKMHGAAAGKAHFIKKEISGNHSRFILFVRKHKPKGVEVLYPQIFAQDFLHTWVYDNLLFSTIKNEATIFPHFVPLKRGPPRV